ncbi:metalloregulator ArsR/SmtB family transcription factor [Pimelobacter simplex]|uniref:Metalloregulator ArsR/SmtB family transcription factor n=1 Tax=Nocardioides simplex TaxID=2045 RepID=A0A7J5DYL8_NOCSI|nr:metalloregulator ArsR/SmtB family transcription factor [Pimelobacter simplex]KAB2810983.1 metalloregulator ArsR/SmtB family transcription factor [Pimelobacter simplex]
MNTEQITDLDRRAAVYGALSDPARLQIVDILTLGDASPSELVGILGTPSNLLAHHLKVLREAGLVSSHRSQGDGRKQYLRLVDTALALAAPAAARPDRVVFVCTANSARSHLASALWRRASSIPAISAGTHPAERIDAGAVDVATRRGLPLPRIRPRQLSDIAGAGTDGSTARDLIVTVCDLAHEELAVPNRLHWSVPDPVRLGTPEAFDAAYDELEARVVGLAARLAS